MKSKKNDDIEEMIDLIKVEPSDKSDYQATLDRLECNGVDNWDGYDMYDDDYEEVDYEKYVKENYEKVK